MRVDSGTRSTVLTATILVIGTIALISACEPGLGRLADILPGLSSYRARLETAGEAESVALHETHAYVLSSDASGTDQSILVVDITDRSNPTLVHEFDVLTGHNPRLTTFTHSDSTTYLMLTSGQGDVLVFDLHSPADPTQVTAFDPFGVTGSVLDSRFSGDLLYFMGTGFAIWDASDSDAANWVEISEIPSGSFAGDPSSFCLAGDYAYLASGDVGVEIVDISVPASASIVATEASFSPVTDVEAISDVGLIVTDDHYSCRIVNIGNPLAPVATSELGGVMGEFSVPSPQPSTTTTATGEPRGVACFRFDATEVFEVNNELLGLATLVFPGQDNETPTSMKQVVSSSTDHTFYAVAHGEDGLVLFDLDD